MMLGQVIGVKVFTIGGLDEREPLVVLLRERRTRVVDMFEKAKLHSRLLPFRLGGACSPAGQGALI